MSFSNAGQQVAQYLRGVTQLMMMMAEDFNEFMRVHGHDLHLDVKGGDESLFLRLQDSSERAEVNRSLIAIGIGYDNTKGQMSFVINLDTDSPSEMAETFYPLDGQSMDVMKRRCVAEILMIAGPVAGAEYMAYHREKFNALLPTERKLH